MADELQVPTTAEVREAYQMTGDGLDFKAAARRRGEEFDAWLALQQAELDPWPLEYPDGSRGRDFEDGVADYLALDGTVHLGGEIGRGLEFRPRLGFSTDRSRYIGV